MQSDLCAQWYAAQAARDAADWSGFQVWLGLVGTVLVVLSLGFAVHGVVSTRKALGLAEEAIGHWTAANGIATQGLQAAAEANERAAEANTFAARANEIAAGNLLIFAKDFDERMRPRCVVIAITLIDKCKRPP